MKNTEVEFDTSKIRKGLCPNTQEEYIDYNGEVYCCTVPNHVIYVRRNGKGVWCGNSLRCYPGHFVTNKILQILHKYEYLSQFVCTECGQPATMVTAGYIASICDDCWKDKYRHNKITDIQFVPQFIIKSFGRNTEHVKTIVDVSDEWNRYLESIGWIL